MAGKKAYSLKRCCAGAYLDVEGEGEGTTIGGPHVVPATAQAVEMAVRVLQLHVSYGISCVADDKHEPAAQPTLGNDIHTATGAFPRCGRWVSCFAFSMTRMC